MARWSSKPHRPTLRRERGMRVYASGVGRFYSGDSARILAQTEVEIHDEASQLGLVEMEVFTWLGPDHTTNGKMSGWLSQLRKLRALFRRNG